MNGTQPKDYNPYTKDTLYFSGRYFSRLAAMLARSESPQRLARNLEL